ncbi:hypothetical protein EVAR_84667_1 [Eumeta japonica]|uniref:Uncharacterized protein n=1 Tax=Eumeta variegata TaxID=151549 RepID=A0A4C1UYL5_EUMVA|nr:hypothetical protein EVAR_84667_1 [Eumeta japonica]
MSLRGSKNCVDSAVQRVVFEARAPNSTPIKGAVTNEFLNGVTLQQALQFTNSSDLVVEKIINSAGDYQLNQISALNIKKLCPIETASNGFDIVNELNKQSERCKSLISYDKNGVMDEKKMKKINFSDKCNGSINEEINKIGDHQYRKDVNVSSTNGILNGQTVSHANENESLDLALEKTEINGEPQINGDCNVENGENTNEGSEIADEGFRYDIKIEKLQKPAYRLTRPKVLKNLESGSYLYDRLYDSTCPRVYFINEHNRGRNRDRNQDQNRNQNQKRDRGLKMKSGLALKTGSAWELN